LRSRIEAALGQWGRFVAEHAIWVVLLTLGASGLFVTQLQHFRLDTTLDSYFHESDPVRLQYDAYRDLFGRDAMVLIALKPRGGVFQADFLEELRTLHKELEEEVPLIAEITSLINVRETLGNEDGLQVDDFLEQWPETEQALRDAESRAIANPFYHNLVISKDAAITSIALEIEPYVVSEETDSLAGFEGESESTEDTRRVLTNGDDDVRITNAIKAVLSRHESDDLEIHLAGIPAFNAVLSERMGGDIIKFTVLSLLIIATFLALLFRRAAAVVLPIVTVLLSVLMTLSLMGATDTPLMPPTQVVPSLLLAVGVGGAVHLLTMFYQSQRRGDDKSTSIAYSLSHSGLPIIMTSLTTAGGLISFMPAALRPMSHFGWITPIGVLFSLFFVLTLLPALVALFPMSDTDPTRNDTASQRALVATASFSMRHGRFVLFAWGALITLSIAGMFRLTLGNDMIKWLPAHDDMRQAIEFLNDEFGGGASIEVLVSAQSENALHDPELLLKLEEVHEWTRSFENSGLHADKTVSIVDVIKETHRALNENRDDYYAIPESRALVSQELLLFENSGSDDVEDLVTTQFNVARITVRVPFVDAAFYSPFMDAYLAGVEKILGPNNTVALSGAIPLMGRTISAALDTCVRSYATALIVITFLMIVLIGSLRVGLLSMLPNLAPVAFALGLMGWLGIALDMMNLMLGSIVIGLAVDDTIHFMHNFRREIERTGDVASAVTHTIRGTGQALLFTSCVLATGFLVYTQAYMDMLFDFGFLTASAIVVAFLADLTLSPALVSRVNWARRVGAAANESALPDRDV
jgi:predicted RND superfamily exporter protein